MRRVIIGDGGCSISVSGFLDTALAQTWPEAHLRSHMIMNQSGAGHEFANRYICPCTASNMSLNRIRSFPCICPCIKMYAGLLTSHDGMKHKHVNTLSATMLLRGPCPGSCMCGYETPCANAARPRASLKPKTQSPTPLVPFKYSAGPRQTAYAGARHSGASVRLHDSRSVRLHRRRLA